MPLVSFCTPWKYQKTFGYLMFSGGIETETSGMKLENEKYGLDSSCYLDDQENVQSGIMVNVELKDMNIMVG